MCKGSPQVDPTAWTGERTVSILSTDSPDRLIHTDVHWSRSVTPLSLSDTDPAELAVDAIVVGLHTTNGAGANGSAPLLAPGAESVAVAFDGTPHGDAGAARRDRARRAR